MASCSHQPNPASEQVDASTAIPELAATNGQPVSAPPEPRKLIKEGTIRFAVAALADARTQLVKTINKHAGYIASESENTYSDRIIQSFTVRVPAASFDDFLTAATQGVTEVTEKDIRSRDVTKEFVDVEARLNTKKRVEERYLALLAKAGSVKDILEIEKAIGALRAEIESMEGRRNYLVNQAAFSTLTIVMEQPIETSVQFGEKFRSSFTDGWHTFVWALVALAAIWPFLILAVAGFVTVRLLRKRKIRTGLK